MQLFFNKTIQVAKTLPKNQNWNYAKAGLKRNLQTVIDYYQSRGFAVKGNHFLVKLINSIGVEHSLNIERYYDIVNAKTNKLGMHFKMTSSVYSGQLFDGVFYGPGTKEIIIADDEYISPYEIQSNWKNIQSVKVLDHPRSDLYLNLPNGKVSGTETGTATIVINIPALALQYRQFAIEQARRMQHGENPATVAFFIYRYVLPNMLYTHLDVALFNRIVNWTIGKPMGESTVKHAFALLDYTNRVDDVYRDLVKEIENTEVDFWTILRSIPMCSVDNAKTLMLLPEMAPTRQLAWAEFLTRLKCVEFLVYCAPDHGKKMNQNELNYLLKKILMYSSDGVFTHITDKELYADTIRTVKDIVELTNGANYKIQ